MASLSMAGTGNAANIAELLAHEIQGSGMSVQMVDSIYRPVADGGVCIMVFEKYYWRASNRASLTVVVSGEGGSVYVDAIGSGGGQGPLFKFSWGAEEDFVGLVADILAGQGFAY